MAKNRVIVVGAGNAALCAAISARENGAEVLILERAPHGLHGGNSYFTGGLIRFAHSGLAEIEKSFPEVAQMDILDVPAYEESDFFNDMAAITEYRADPDLVELLVGRSRATASWLHEHGVRYAWALGRHAYKFGGRFQFFSGVPLEVEGGGAGLVDALMHRVEEMGCSISYGTRALDLLQDEKGTVVGLSVIQGGERQDLRCDGVVLACGGFEANARMRSAYLGPNWDLARVRGTAFNTGDGIEMALRAGAQPAGHWSGCHAVAWDANAPLTGDRALGDSFSRHSYPLGIVVNRRAQRFLDEGADFHTNTYAKYGAEIIRQPGLVAYQIFDSKVEPFLKDLYRMPKTSKVVAGSYQKLAEGLELDVKELTRTIEEFNGAVGDEPFNPNVKDGRATKGLVPQKSNWAQALDTPPFYGYPVTTGITFTFGGVRVNQRAEVVSVEGQVIRGLTCAGEMVGGLFFHNYPSGTGLMSGAVFGQLAGASAAALAGGG